MKFLPPKFDQEVERFLVDFVYTDLGLVPPSHYPRWVNGSLDSCLESLGNKESRKARRKFRKISRRLKGHKKMSYDKKQALVKWLIINEHLRHPISDNDD